VLESLEKDLKRQSILSFVSVAVISLLGFIAVIIFSNCLGAELMGVYYIFFTYLAIFELIGNGGIGSVAQKVTCGVDSAVQKYVAEGNEQNEYYSAYFVIRLGFTIIATVILVACSGLVQEIETYQLLLFLVGALLAGAFSGLITSGIRAKQKISWYSICNLFSQLVYYVVAVVLIVLGFSLYGIFAGYIIGLVLLGLLCLLVFRYRLCRFTKKHFKDIISYSVFSIIIGGIAVFISATDTFLINHYLGNAEVGVYRVALHVTLISLLAVNAMNIAVFPKMSRAFGDGDMSSVSRYGKIAITYGFMLAIPALVGGVLVGDVLLSCLYGTEFLSGYWSLVVLFVYQAFYVLLSVLMIMFEAIRKIRISCIILSIGFVINLLLDIFLIQSVGMEGAALASLVAVVFNLVFCILLLRKYLAIEIDGRRLLIIGASAIVMGLVIEGCRMLFIAIALPVSAVSVVGLVLVGVLVYGGLMALLDREVRGIVLGFIKRKKVEE